MTTNQDILFHLSKGNPSNNKLGLSVDIAIYGQSLGGEIFTFQELDNRRIEYHSLQPDTYEIFDPIVPSDIIKNKVNYRAIFIRNDGDVNISLDTITCSSISGDAIIGYPISDVNIAYEGIYTIGEVTRPIPAEIGKVTNPSVYLTDEYDSTNILSGLSFGKTLTSMDLPSELPPNAVLKMWLKREIIVSPSSMPDEPLVESFVLTINETGGLVSTPLSIKYNKLQGRIPLTNWFDCTVTTGKGIPIVFKEFLPKNFDLTAMNVVKTFTYDDKVLIFYYTEPVPNVKNYMLLVVKPNAISTNNKYIQVIFETTNNIDNNELLVSKNNIDIHQSYFDKNIYYIFWTDEIQVSTLPECESLTTVSQYYRVSIDELMTNIWTEYDFDTIVEGYDNRKIETYELIFNKIVRKDIRLINVEHFDDLFILFTKDTSQTILENISNININKNELLYIFEKDIIDANKTNPQKTRFISEKAQLFSQRLYPSTVPTTKQIISFNNSKNVDLLSVIEDSASTNTNVISNRKIQYLLDGTRYIEKNSVHHKEFKLNNKFITYELPLNTELTDLMLTASIAVENDTNIYESMKSTYLTNMQIPNSIGSSVYDKPNFHKNIIDATNIDSVSIPKEWADRIYKDEWKPIISTLPNSILSLPYFKVSYNFFSNLWKVSYVDNEVLKEVIYSYLDNQTQTIDSTGVATTGTSGLPFGKAYDALKIYDLKYVLEPNVYQPLSVNISTTATTSGTFSANFKFYFKGNTTPLINVTSIVSDLSKIGYMFINPDSSFNYRINYLNVSNGENISKSYLIRNIHAVFLNNISYTLSEEKLTNPTLYSNQAAFKFYRTISINGITISTSDLDKTGDITIPVTLYGNGYINETQSNIGITVPLDFKKLNINDKNIRLYINNFSDPLNFKIGYYDYEKEIMVIWVRLKNLTDSSKPLYIFYGNTIKEKPGIVQQKYIYLKNNIYSSDVFGAWHFDSIIYDDRLSFNDGKIFNIGEPLIYEKTFDSQLKLSKITKEYVYGVAKIFKSNLFNLDLDIPAEESLFTDESKKNDFITFIKSTVSLLKPGYTDINKIQQFGVDILETTGDSSMGETMNKRVAGLIALTPDTNVNTYYNRISDTKFNALTSFNGYSNKVDWVISKPIDTSIYKAGVLRLSGKVKSETIKFETPFKDNNYYVFFASPVNQKIYWNILCPNRFSITASHYLSKEVAWMAFHRDIFGGVYNPGTIYVGKRIITSSTETTSGEAPTTANLSSWYNQELIIKPEVGVDNDPGTMDIDPTDPGYAILLSANENINVYWNEKNIDNFRIRTSSPTPCTVHWAVIKNGVEWWQELI